MSIFPGWSKLGSANSERLGIFNCPISRTFDGTKSVIFGTINKSIKDEKDEFLLQIIVLAIHFAFVVDPLKPLIGTFIFRLLKPNSEANCDVKKCDWDPQSRRTLPWT
ncbi:hypothetical protein AVEN_275474-1 [Araneus ventricosus]|uniref:Uncharacterized protein n=1 Tax=Araneus ventricosus TaxID=182803 RepID=A0A4Y2T5D2_ARAVE|nr:hypothetical protein AVEN_275474-1 [Araneus ventricosus]